MTGEKRLTREELELIEVELKTHPHVPAGRSDLLRLIAYARAADDALRQVLVLAAGHDKCDGGSHAGSLTDIADIARAARLSDAGEGE